ncbi:MAG: alpha/beta hydrolase [Thermoplasmata archaeon]|nr:alpha/beta hydrolase [Thermoplasmata archaeon]
MKMEAGDPSSTGPSDPWPALVQGTGRPVVFLHGYPLSHAIWTALVPHLTAHCRTVLLDLPGYGLAAGWPVPTTLGGFADSVHATLRKHLREPCVLVGHSFGGYIALELYRTHPELFSGLVLADTRSEADTPEAREKRLATIRRLEETRQPLDVEATARGLLAAATWASDGALPTVVREIVRSVGTRTVIASLQAIAGRPDLTPVLPTVRVPTLVIWGDEDALIPADQSKSMVPRVPGATGVGIPGAGHLPCLEKPELFSRATLEFLTRLDPR